MLGADRDKLEDILMKPNKYRRFLQECKDRIDDVPQVINQEGGRSNIPTKALENKVVRYNSDPEYNLLHSIVHNTPIFLETLDKYEQMFVDYRYKRVDPFVWDIDEIARVIGEEYPERKVDRTTVGRIRDRMLTRFAQMIGYPLS